MQPQMQMQQMQQQQMPALLALAAVATVVAAGAQRHRGATQHFVDADLLEARSAGLRVVLGPVSKRGPVLSEAAPWEAGFSNSYPSVSHDGSTYRMFYNSYLGQARLELPSGGLSHRDVHWHWDQTKTQGATGLRPLVAPVTCNSWGGVLQATSQDGVSFTRPALHDLLANGSLGPLRDSGAAAQAPLATDTNVAVVSCNAPGRTLFVDPNPAAPASQRYKMIGCFSNNGSADSGFHQGGKDLKAMYSSDGASFTAVETLQSADVPWLMAHDGLANIVFDPSMGTGTSDDAQRGQGGGRYMIFMRTYDLSAAVKDQARRLSRMVSKTATWGGEGTWEPAVEVLKGESGYEIYELRPFRLASWRQGLYFGIGMYYADAEASGKVYAELLRSGNYGQNWTRLAPHSAFIPHGSGNAFDNTTTYAAAPFSTDGGATLLYYYSGGNGPHNGVNTTTGMRVRDDSIARAEGSAHAIAGLAHPDPAVVSSVRTRPVEVLHGTTSLWLTLSSSGSVAAAVGGTGDSLGPEEVTVELRQNGQVLPGFEAASSSLSFDGPSSDSGDGVAQKQERSPQQDIRRAEILWHNGATGGDSAGASAGITTLVGQQVAVAVTFRNRAIYSFSLQ